MNEIALKEIRAAIARLKAAPQNARDKRDELIRARGEDPDPAKDHLGMGLAIELGVLRGLVEADAEYLDRILAALVAPQRRNISRRKR